MFEHIDIEQKETSVVVTSHTDVSNDTLDDIIEASVVEYASFYDTLTVAVIKLPNNFKLVGQAHCANPDDYDKLKGEQYALADARSKLWELENYRVASAKLN